MDVSSKKELLHSISIVEFFWMFYTLILFVAMAHRARKPWGEMEDTEDYKVPEQQPGQQKYQSNESKEPKEPSQEGEGDNNEIVVVDIQLKKDNDTVQEENNSYMKPSNMQPSIESAYSSGAAVVHPTKTEQKSGGVAFLLASERFLVDYLPWMLITLLNVLTLGCYIYNAFMFILWLLIVVFVNELNIGKKLFNAEPSKFSENLHHVILITLFLVNFGNVQTAL